VTPRKVIGCLRAEKPGDRHDEREQQPLGPARSP
jgi:hypothetical protein